MYASRQDAQNPHQGQYASYRCGVQTMSDIDSLRFQQQSQNLSPQRFMMQNSQVPSNFTQFQPENSPVQHIPSQQMPQPSMNTFPSPNWQFNAMDTSTTIDQQAQNASNKWNATRESPFQTYAQTIAQNTQMIGVGLDRSDTWHIQSLQNTVVGKYSPYTPSMQPFQPGPMLSPEYFDGGSNVAGQLCSSCLQQQGGTVASRQGAARLQLQGNSFLQQQQQQQKQLKGKGRAYRPPTDLSQIIRDNQQQVRPQYKYINQNGCHKQRTPSQQPLPLDHMPLSAIEKLHFLSNSSYIQSLSCTPHTQVNDKGVPMKLWNSAMVQTNNVPSLQHTPNILPSISTKSFINSSLQMDQPSQLLSSVAGIPQEYQKYKITVGGVRSTSGELQAGICANTTSYEMLAYDSDYPELGSERLISQIYTQLQQHQNEHRSPLHNIAISQLTQLDEFPFLPLVPRGARSQHRTKRLNVNPALTPTVEKSDTQSADLNAMSCQSNQNNAANLAQQLLDTNISPEVPTNLGISQHLGNIPQQLIADYVQQELGCDRKLASVVEDRHLNLIDNHKLMILPSNTRFGGETSNAREDQGNVKGFKPAFDVTTDPAIGAPQGLNQFAMAPGSTLQSQVGNKAGIRFTRAHVVEQTNNQTSDKTPDYIGPSLFETGDASINSPDVRKQGGIEQPEATSPPMPQTRLKFQPTKLQLDEPTPISLNCKLAKHDLAWAHQMYSQNGGTQLAFQTMNGIGSAGQCSSGMASRKKRGRPRKNPMISMQKPKCGKKAGHHGAQVSQKTSLLTWMQNADYIEDLREVVQHHQVAKDRLFGKGQSSLVGEKQQSVQAETQLDLQLQNPTMENLAECYAHVAATMPSFIHPNVSKLLLQETSQKEDCDIFSRYQSFDSLLAAPTDEFEKFLWQVHTPVEKNEPSGTASVKGKQIMSLPVQRQNDQVKSMSSGKAKRRRRCSSRGSCSKSSVAVLHRKTRKGKSRKIVGVQLDNLYNQASVEGGFLRKGARSSFRKRHIMATFQSKTTCPKACMVLRQQQSAQKKRLTINDVVDVNNPSSDLSGQQNLLPLRPSHTPYKVQINANEKDASTKIQKRQVGQSSEFGGVSTSAKSSIWHKLGKADGAAPLSKKRRVNRTFDRVSYNPESSNGI